MKILKKIKSIIMESPTLNHKEAIINNCIIVGGIVILVMIYWLFKNSIK